MAETLLWKSFTDQRGLTYSYQGQYGASLLLWDRQVLKCYFSVIKNGIVYTTSVIDTVSWRLSLKG